MAARRTLAAGGTRAAELTLGSGRSDHPASAFEMGAAWRDLSRWAGAAERQSSSLAAIADGPHGAGIFGLSEFHSVYRVEQFADLFDHRRLSRNAHRRRAADAPSGDTNCAAAVQRAS